jgi:hypothetical protein
MRKSSVRYADRGVGVGGWNCPCCAPAPGKRKEVYRSAKRKEKREAFRIELEELNSTAK